MINNLNINPASLFLRSPDLKWKAALTCSIVVFLLLFLLQPFNAIVHGFTLVGILRILSYALATGLVLLLAEFYFIRGFRLLFHKNHFYLPLIWYSFEVILAASAIFLVKNAWAGFMHLSWYEYQIVLERTLAIAIFPIILLFVFLLSQKNKNKRLNLLADQKNEMLSIGHEQLLYLQSQDNYTEVHYLQNDEMKKRLLRGSLSSFEQQLSSPMLRCHRSYIVNLMAIESFKGNSQGYQLSLHHGEVCIKVSRKYAIAFDQAWKAHCQSRS